MLLLKQNLLGNNSEFYCVNCSDIYIRNRYDAKKSRVGHLCNKCKNLLNNMINPTQEKLREVFTYDPVKGTLKLRINTKQQLADSIVGYPHNEGYIAILLGNKGYLAHRLIWLMQTGEWPKQIDHINHNRADNSWANLRNVVSRQNQLNTGLKRNNSSKVNGVRILPSGRFCAFIMVNRVQISLGTYDTLEEATLVRQQANVKYGFHVNHGS